MKKTIFKGLYPVYVKEYEKNTIACKTLDDCCQHFRNKIEAHPFAAYIHTFDHYDHTSHVEGNVIDETIAGAKIILFCFGKKLTDPRILSVRPRGIGICETTSHFVISFLEVPMPALNDTMVEWVNEVSTG